MTFETYNFRQLCQEQDEPIDKSVTRLRETASRCDFHNKDREIKDQIVQKCFSELLDTQAKEMENPSILKVKQQSKRVKREKNTSMRRQWVVEKRKNKPMLEGKSALPVAVRGLIQMAENLVRHGDLSVEVLVWGSDEQDHYRALSATFQQLRNSGLTLKRSKCEFGKRSINFFGLTFSDQGIGPDPEKVEALQHVSPPTNQAELRSFLGMANYSAPFIYNYATLAAPLRNLVKKNARWKWKQEHEKSFQAIKETLRKTALLNYYNPILKTEVVCNGSPVGVSAMLVKYGPKTQKPRVVTYNSRSLTEVETQYGQIERESLAIQYGCLRNEIYLLGRDFDVVTDHKPLVSLYNNPRRPGPFRVERMRLKLQGFSFKVVYRPGKQNPADYTSRQPLPLSGCTKEKLKESAELEAHVNWVITNDVSPSLKLKEIRSATYLDPVLHDLYKAIKN